MKLRPKRIDAYECETLRIYRQGDYEGCIRYGRDILQNVPCRIESESDEQNLGNIYYLLGNCYLEEEDPSNAEVCLKTAIGQYDGNGLYYRDYAIALARQGKEDEAEAEEGRRDEYYQKALERFEFLYENGYAARQMMENIAILREQTGDYEGAREMLLQMTEQYPEDYVGYKRLAFLEADIQQGRETADRDYRQFAEYYHRAQELYEGRGTDQEADQEMEMLAVMLRELEDGNWL